MPFTKGHPAYKGVEKGQFKKGAVPFNKGTMGVMKPNKTSFKKGEQILCKCKECGKEFYRTPKEKKVFCSKKCSDKNPNKYWLGKKRIDITGERCHLWRDGKSQELYTIDWTETLKRSIRERDNYVCQECSKQQGDIALDVHHIDYNKDNCNPNNLITLCRSCHSKTNFNPEYWIDRFNQKLNNQNE